MRRKEIKISLFEEKCEICEKKTKEVAIISEEFTEEIKAIICSNCLKKAIKFIKKQL